MSVFRRSSIRYSRTPEPETPYQRAAQVWDDRIGSARVQAKNWRLMAFGSLILSCGLAGGLVWQSTHGSVVPWVVQVDKLGEAQAVAPAVADYRPSDPQIAWYLAHFIVMVRSLPADPIIVRANWLKAYDFTTTAGAMALNDYARANDPFASLGKQQVAIDVSSVIRASPDSFRVAWVEHRYQDGALAGTTRWTAILTIAIQPPTDADRLRKNPLGIYVNAINWSKELGQ
ncbi:MULTISPECIES: conjugal transfer protein TrbF [Bradyrhizobium]|uniref:Conjugal transfer protein TrbF n=1 Tax=Bradyrhizobium frederickii TaxID=2560054 RepID=A0A4Y9KSV9_9BRAD|nr:MULTISPECIES: conjugal transfer protein TrbF [Bradyrhizobium]RTE88257.1 conjugal transfer protein TrbF [Bradyrhizobium sp. LVM 105]TFV30287.1 conjugal transfer protein TrbF [Bradyrhizobium frederickii]